MPVKTFEGTLDASELCIGVVVSRFNGFITEQLLKGAVAALEQRGCQSIRVAKVPGAWELAHSFHDDDRAGREVARAFDCRV